MNTRSPRPVHGLILAAGASTRMGQPKALLRWGGVPLVAGLALRLLDAGLASVTVVVGAHPAVAEAVPAPAQVAFAARWAEGMRASLRAGLTACAPGDVLLTHVDRPVVAPETLAALLAAPGEGAVVPTYLGAPGHPVRLPAALRPRLMAPDDAPLRTLLTAPHHLAVPDPGVVLNLNAPADWQAFLARWPADDTARSGAAAGGR